MATASATRRESPAPQRMDTQPRVMCIARFMAGLGGSAVGPSSWRRRDELLNGSRGNSHLTPPHLYLSGDFTPSSHYPSTSSPKGCQNYYPHLERGKELREGDEVMWQRLARESVSKAGLNPLSLPNRGLAWVSVRAVPSCVCRGQLSCKGSRGSACVSAWCPWSG